ncbi:family B DNA polymerase, partial [Klebsiella pneumoniae]|uniref:family B DNA polymerase n=1 Tax=Klebsiella pneumoniae TaxID=573 RepID=UPI001D0E7148
VLGDYAILINAFWVTNNMPASVAWIRDSVRQVAITSDTDSTIFTVQDWVQWYCGKVDFSEEAFAVDYT